MITILGSGNSFITVGAEQAGEFDSWAVKEKNPRMGSACVREIKKSVLPGPGR
jgi:hypothetical protein